MGLLDNLLGRSKSPNITINYVNNVMATIGDLDPADLYETQDALRAVIDFIAEGIASCPLKVYERKDDNDRVRDTTSTWALLLKEPNDHMTTYDFVNALCHELELYRDALIMVVQDAYSTSGWTLEVIPQNWILSTKTDGFKITKYKIDNPYSDKPAEWFDAKNFVRIHGYETGKPGSTLSPIAPLKNILKEQISAWAFRNQVWSNNGRMTAYLTRPADAGEWKPEQRDRFIKAWKERYTGNNAKEAGGMPLLEDGMEIKTTQFNAREAEWASALTLSRESVAAVYRIAPSMIWGGGSGSSGVAIKEQTRILYSDSFSPRITMIAQALNRFLLPMLGAPENAYVEFDLRSKLNGSFEEQANVLVRTTGTAFQTINEARALMNLPRIEDDPDADRIVKPLNVLFGGQSSPLDPTGDGDDAEKAALSGQNAAVTPDNVKEATSAHETKEEASETAVVVKLKGAPSTDEVMDIASAFRKFYKRQRKSVLNEIDRSRDKGTLHDIKAPSAVIERPALTIDDDMQRSWYDFERWERELKDDLMAQLSKLTVDNVADVLQQLYDSTESLDEEYIMGYLEDYITKLSFNVNKKTLEELIRAVDDADSFSADDALKSTPAGVFDYAEDTRADHDGQCVGTNIRGWSNIAAVHMSGKQKTTYKTWRVTSANPRPWHKSMDGETIPYANPNWCEDPTDSDHWMKPGCGEHNRFSNGLRWPGDFAKYDVEEVAGCKCRMDLEVRM